MKSFRDYLTESERTYDYRIKLCGRVPEELIRALKARFDQFDPVRMGDTKSTPIQKIPTDFPNFANEAVTMFDVSFRYPAIEPQIKQLAQLLDFDPNRVVMQTQKYVDGMVEEMDKIEEQNKDLLTDTDYPAPDAEQRALKKDYSAAPHDHVVLKNAYRTDFTVAGGNTPAARTTNDLPQGVKGPMYKINRPPKPATGANPRG
jgi:hypothetical protein